MVLTGIDHAIVAVDDPIAAARSLEEVVGLIASGGGRHEAHGTLNQLVWMGDSYVELMGVFDAQLAERSWWGRHILRVLESGADRCAGQVLASDDLAADVEILRGHGSTVGDPSTGERRGQDGEIVAWQTARLPEPDPDLGLTFLIQHDLSGAEWRASDRSARAVREMPGLGRVQLARVEFVAADVARASMRLLREFGLQFRPSLAGGGARDATLGAQTVRLLPLTAGARTTIVVRASAAAGARTFSMLGCDWLIVPGVAI